MTRKVLWAVLGVGLLLVVAPFALQMPTRAGNGQKMMDAFEPIMQPDNVAKTASYYNDVFVPLGQVVPAMSQENVSKFDAYLKGMAGVGTDAEKLTTMFAAQYQLTPAQVQSMMGEQFPSMSQLLGNLPQLQSDFGGLLSLMGANVGIFEQVPAGLDHYRPLVTTMEGNVGNFRDVNALPPFGLFTWFFVVPGILLMALAGAGLLHERQVALVSVPRPKLA